MNLFISVYDQDDFDASDSDTHFESYCLHASINSNRFSIKPEVIALTLCELVDGKNRGTFDVLDSFKAIADDKNTLEEHLETYLMPACITDEKTFKPFIRIEESSVYVDSIESFQHYWNSIFPNNVLGTTLEFINLVLSPYYCESDEEKHEREEFEQDQEDLLREDQE